MARILTKKQQAQLEQLNRETLLDIVQQVIHDNDRVREWLVNGWLSEPEDVVKRLANNYMRQTKGNVFYDYYEADSFFEQLSQDIVLPLGSLVEKLPEQVAAQAAKMLLDFDRLTQTVDTSSGGWQNYTFDLFTTWGRALVAQKNRTPEETAQAIFTLAQGYDWFEVQDLSPWHRALGNNTLRVLANLFKDAGDYDSAVSLLLDVRDIDTALSCLAKGSRYKTRNGLNLARLLIDELRAKEAIALLHNLEADISARSADFRRWVELLVTALLEEGEHEHAREVALNAFSRSVNHCFWHLWLKAGGDESRDLPIFLQLAGKADSEQAIVFLADIQQYALLSDIIIGSAPVGVSIHLPGEINGSFWRTLSSTLYKQGYAQAAVILRRRLAEYAINRASSKYYTYAANDAKKAIDYCVELESAVHFIHSQGWLQSLYKTHFRKYSLWKTMQEKIAGLSISKDQGLILRTNG